MPSGPDPQQAPPSKQRRRPAPTMGGNWIWLLVLFLGGLVIYSSLASPRDALYWSDLYFLLSKDQLAEVAQQGDTYEGKLLSDDAAKERDQAREKRLADVNARLADAKLPEAAKQALRAEAEALKTDGERIKKIREKLKTNKTFRVEKLQGNDVAFQNLLADKAARGLVVYSKQTFAWLWQATLFLLPVFLLLAFVLLILPRFRDPLGGGFLNNYIKSPAKRYERSKVRVTFEDVAGMQNAKAELKEVVEFLRSPEKFQRLGAVVPKGVLLVGPPGTGKTLVARAVAGEAGVPFFSISGSEFIQMFVGVGASRVRDMFKTAKENAPCILFIDEIDAVGRMRGAGLGGGSDEREQTLNQILSEMDGFTPTETVIVMAATNRPDVLDSALLRPGRFDRHITIDRPTWQGRMQILKVHTRNKPLADDVDLEKVARGMIGMTGADLRNLANEAALLATRDGKSKIDRSDFERAADRVLIGAKREEVFSEDEKRRTAYHEAGHALCAWLTPKADPLFKVTIVPRGQTGGVTRILPDEERLGASKAELEARMTVIMGGRAAERLVYEETTTGASSDLKQVTRLARAMVTQFGMSDKIGPVAYRIGEEHIFLGKEIHEPRDFGEGTASLIDEEVRRIVREADEHAFQLLKTNRHLMEKLVEGLLQKEELLREEIDILLKVDSNGVVSGDGVTGITNTIDSRNGG